MRTLLSYLLACGLSASAASTIDPANRYAYGANVGWIDFRGDPNNGAAIGEYICSGYIYAANVGWINLGGGTPVNGIRYQNNSRTDYGVNHDGQGNLRGFAYGANIGWINFESTGTPKVDLGTGRFSGYAYSGNCGWISLSNAFAHVQTDVIRPGLDSDSDGITDAWELSHTNTLAAFTARSDTDGDGQTDRQEAVADTDPLNANDYLFITYFKRSTPNHVEVRWTSQPTRFYRLEQQAALGPADPWQERTTGFESLPGWNSVLFDDSASQYFYRIRVVKPLSP
jgi:hypothetical protein